jgi:acetolactate decarboxylase
MSLKNCGSIVAVLILTALLTICGCSEAPTHLDNTPDQRETLTQISTIDALMGGLYDGVMSVDNLKEYGDFGIGTFAALDGEMLAYDGYFYQIEADGICHPVEGTIEVPFAAMTFFDADREEKLTECPDFEQFQEYLDSRLPTANIFYAIRVDGTFSYMKTRSVPSQQKPYPPLTEVTKNQPVFEFQNVRGTMIGFRCPPYVTAINVPGYHLHFITEKQDAGGHVLEFEVYDASIRIDDTSELLIILPNEDSGFYQMDLSQSVEGELEKVEK